MAERALKKIIKNLKSTDDNDKLASLAYLIKVFPSPADLANSEMAPEIWSALRSSQFLERALMSTDAQPLVFAILSVFCHIAKPSDFLCFLSPLKSIIKTDGASNTFIEICQNLDDVSPLFELIDVSLDNLMLLATATEGPKHCTMTQAVIDARKSIFELLNHDEDLSHRRYLFLLISHLVKLTNYNFAIFSRPSQVDINSFLAAERLAFVELRLQLDVPLNYREIEAQEKAEREKEMSKPARDKDDVYIDDGEEEEKIEPMPGMKFAKNIGPLLNPELSAASCELLELLVTPLIEHEDALSDEEINHYFNSLNTIIKDSMEIIKAANGERDKVREELRCLLSITALWLREAEFLSANKSIVETLPKLINLLKFFPVESLQYLPAFESWSDSDLKNLKKAKFNELAKTLIPLAKEGDKTALASIISKINKI